MAPSTGRRGLLTVAALLAVLLLPSGWGSSATADLPSGQARAVTVGWKQVSAGTDHTCGVRTNGRLFCWGANLSGQLGNEATDATDVPVQVFGARTDWKAVSTGGSHTCALRTSGRLFCWGSDSEGALGNGAGGSSLVPSQVAGKRTDWKAVAAGQDHTCALRTSRRLFCWGDNAYGQVGDGTEDDRFAPRQVAGSWSSWTQVGAGVSHTCGRRASGRAYCWGSGQSGEIGDGGISNKSAPTQVAGNRTDWASVAAGYYHSCGRRTTGRLFCWGDNPSGELGVGPIDQEQLTPAQVTGNRTDWVGVSTSNEHTCARRSSGRLFCWGSNSAGKLGNADNKDTALPTQVSGSSTAWRGVSSGGGHTCAVTSTHRAYCWGSNLYGQLGDDSNADRWTPTEVVSP